MMSCASVSCIGPRLYPDICAPDRTFAAAAIKSGSFLRCILFNEIDFVTAQSVQIVYDPVDLLLQVFGILFPGVRCSAPLDPELAYATHKIRVFSTFPRIVRVDDVDR